ncbi:SAM-dependent methyltransferase [Kibdelosporangium lantanae]
MDTNRAGITRVHNALLGGRDNYDVDRAVRDRLLAIDPSFPAAAQDVRGFAFRTVRYIAPHLTQFLDCGLHLPIEDNSHAVVGPGSTVVYASVDPLMLSQARAELADKPNTYVTEVNISRADRVLNDPVVRRHLDFSKPIGLLHVMTLHHFPDHDDPWLTMAQYIDALAPGSYVVLTHMLDPGPDEPLLADTIARVAEVYRASFTTGWPRRAERIQDLLPGLELVPPGLVPTGEWRPERPPAGPPGPMQRLIVGAVARKVVG